jgi:hypothetical protein
VVSNSRNINENEIMFYSDPQKRYRYFSTKIDGLTSIKIQLTKARMQALRADTEFQRIEHLVDILAQGGGWYSITAKDNNYLDQKFGTRTDGAAVWIRALNTRLLSGVNANPSMPNVQYVKRVTHAPVCERKLQALTNKFGRYGKAVRA